MQIASEIQEFKRYNSANIIPMQELKRVFEGTNFGIEDTEEFKQHRMYLENSLLKISLGWRCGYTITRIMQQLKLIDINNTVTRKGQRVLREVFSGIIE